jgi:hypothetical protein
MEQTLAALLAENPAWRAVLAAYWRAEQDLAARPAPPPPPESPSPPVPPSAAPAFHETGVEPLPTESPRRRVTGVPRLTAIEGVPDDELSAIHGRLIAEGLLQFDVFNRDAGMVYRLTREARLALAAVLNDDADAMANEAILSADADSESLGDEPAGGETLPAAA